MILPDLVIDLIVWYRWKEQIGRVFDEIKREFVVDDDDGGLSYSIKIVSFVNGGRNPGVIWKGLNYRCLDNPIIENYYESNYINNFAKRKRRGWSVDQLIKDKMDLIVGKIPLKYRYSSGLNNLNGFNNN